jgi:hypothetical protein
MTDDKLRTIELRYVPFWIRRTELRGDVSQVDVPVQQDDGRFGTISFGPTGFFTADGVEIWTPAALRTLH